MTKDEAMLELKEAVADLRAQEQRLRRVAAALYEANKAGTRQVDLVAMTGYTREQVRRHVEDEKIRRGEMKPTPRYLRNQERAEKRRAEEEERAKLLAPHHAATSSSSSDSSPS